MKADSVDAPRRMQGDGAGWRTVVLSPKQCAALSNLLGQYQDLLESAIECELIEYVSGKKVDPKDPEIRRRLQRDRRKWRACENFQRILTHAE